MNTPGFDKTYLCNMCLKVIEDPFVTETFGSVLPICESCLLQHPNKELSAIAIDYKKEITPILYDLEEAKKKANDSQNAIDTHNALMSIRKKYEAHQKEHPGCKEDACYLQSTNEIPGNTFEEKKTNTLKYLEKIIEHLGGDTADLKEKREKRKSIRDQEIIEKALEELPKAYILFNQHKKDHPNWIECPLECLDKINENFPGDTREEKAYARDLATKFIENEIRSGRSKEDYLIKKKDGTLWKN